MNERTRVAAIFGWLIIAIALAPSFLILLSILLALSPLVGVFIGAIIGAVCIWSFVRSLNRESVNPSALHQGDLSISN